MNTRPTPSVVADEELVARVALEQAAAALDHVASALEEVHSLSDMGDPAFDASMFGQISAVNRGASLLRRAALAASDRDVLVAENARLRRALVIAHEQAMSEGEAAERYRKALKPFTDAVDEWGGEEHEALRVSVWEHPLGQLVSVLDFWNARAALVPLGGGVATLDSPRESSI